MTLNFYVLAFKGISVQIRCVYLFQTRNEGTKKVMQLLLSVEEGANAEQIDRQLSDTFNKLSDKVSIR